MAEPAPGPDGDVMLSTDAVTVLAKKLVAELLAFRETLERLEREPRPGPTDYGNLNADAAVAGAFAQFSTEAATRSHTALDQVTRATQKVIEFAEAMRNNDQAQAARLAAIASGSPGG
jgi:hypothetical protein